MRAVGTGVAACRAETLYAAAPPPVSSNISATTAPVRRRSDASNMAIEASFEAGRWLAR
jgi:hypothetical protein